MFRANFLFKFLKYKQNNGHDIVQYHSNENFELQDQINIEIIDIDKKISENSKALVEAQIVKFKSTFSRSNNFIEQIGKNVYKTKLEDSINWHQKKLKYLYLRRRELEINLEKLKGIYWINKIKRILNLILIGFFILSTLFIFLSGFMIIIYLLPLIILIFLVYLVSTKRY
ncbi:hypothetical protein [Prochlorococcus marinus]|uniref:hypothetical protein n=1 Tax=Prochlorococcus marinus TaxID=1219 RepID=UPI0022B57C80|nr:hypothetical protein [Prochlorococcus marinus]